MNIAIVGATGNVGRKLLEVIEKLNFKFSELYLIASDKSIGKKITFKGKTSSKWQKYSRAFKICGLFTTFQKSDRDSNDQKRILG